MGEDNKCNKINEKIYKAPRRKYDTYTIKTHRSHAAKRDLFKGNRMAQFTFLGLRSELLISVYLLYELRLF